MKKLLLTTLLMPFLLCAQPEEYAVIGCKIVLEKDEYRHHNGQIHINEKTVESIFESFKAWQMLDFHVFIYVECQSCGQPHPIDYECPNPKCQNRLN